ncbi:hypothetical protein, partial [Citrobacter freundii]|uniref:hypothetical protein n=1 Tax=Citrobacter freundii TaxID=546 RepID=UPI00397E4E0B
SKIFAGSRSAPLALTEAIKSLSNVSGREADIADCPVEKVLSELSKEGANKRGNSSRLTQSFHFFMFEPIFSPVN